MSYLEEALQRQINKGKGDGPLARSIRDQIAARKSGQSAREMYVAGMIKKQK